MNADRIAALRGLQTLADGAIMVGIVALGVPLLNAVTNATSWNDLIIGWQTWTFHAIQSAIVATGTAIIAYIRRKWIDPADNTEPRRAEQ